MQIWLLSLLKELAMHLDPLDSHRPMKNAPDSKTPMSTDVGSMPPRLNLVGADDHHSAPLRRSDSIIIPMDDEVQRGFGRSDSELEVASEYFLG
jgi:hypothetical protein